MLKWDRSYNVEIPSSKFRAKILEVLKHEGYISNYKIFIWCNKIKIIIVDLKYHNGLPVIKEI